MVKYWPKSKTLRFNAVAAAFMAAEMSLGLLEPVFGPALYKAISFVVIVGNAYLRTLTTQPIAGKKKVEKSVD